MTAKEAKEKANTLRIPLIEKDFYRILDTIKQEVEKGNISVLLSIKFPETDEKLVDLGYKVEHFRGDLYRISW